MWIFNDFLFTGFYHFLQAFRRLLELLVILQYPELRAVRSNCPKNRTDSGMDEQLADS